MIIFWTLIRLSISLCFVEIAAWVMPVTERKMEFVDAYHRYGNDLLDRLKLGV